MNDERPAFGPVYPDMTAQEALKLIAPLVGCDPRHLDAYIVVGINTHKNCGHVGGSNNIPYFILPRMLRTMADQMENDINKISNDPGNRKN